MGARRSRRAGRTAISTLDVAVILIPACAALACFAGMLLELLPETVQQLRLPTWGAACSFVAAVMALAAFHAARSSATAADAVYEKTLYRLVSLPGPDGPTIDLGLRYETMSGILLVAVTLSVLLILVGAPASERRPKGDAAVSLCLATAVMTILSPNFFQMFLFFELAGVAVFLLQVAQGTTPRCATAARRLFLVQRGCDIFLILALLWMWNSFHTWDVAAITGRAGQPGPALAAFISQSKDVATHSQRLAVVSVICVCVVAAAVGRALLFPACSRLDDAVHFNPRVSAVIVSTCLMPLGLFLAVRCGTLFVVSGYARTLMCGIGTLTVAVTGIAAAARTDLKQVIGYASIGLFGWMILGLGTGDPTGALAALLLLLVLILAGSALFLATDVVDADGDRGARLIASAAFVVGSFAMASGIWGQSAILSSVWRTAAPETAQGAAAPAESTTPVLTGDFPVLYGVVLFVGVASLAVVAFALSRAFFLWVRPKEPPRDRDYTLSETASPRGEIFSPQ